jgi:hypothetical protein
LDIEGLCHPKQIVTKHLNQNIITTLCGTYILKVKEGCNSDDDDINTNIPNKAIEVPNDNDYHELQPQHPNFTINHLHKS